MKPRLSILATWWFAGFFLFATLSSAQGLRPYEPPTGPQVQLNIFSGMPDPVFELSGEDLMKIKELMDKLPKDPEPAYDSAASAKLGYRGYTIGMLPNGKPGQYVIVRVYRTGVEIRTFFRDEKKSEAVTKLDSSRAFETMLTRLFAEKGLIGPDIRKEIEAATDTRDKRKK